MLSKTASVAINLLALTCLPALAAAAVTITRSVASLNFTVYYGDKNPSSVFTFIVDSTSVLATNTATSTGNFFSASTEYSKNIYAVTATASLGMLVPGTYTGTFVITAQGATSVTIPVTLNIVPYPISPRTLSLSFARTEFNGHSRPGA